MRLTGQPERIIIRILIVVTDELDFRSTSPPNQIGTIEFPIDDVGRYLIVHPFQLWPASRTVVFLRRAWCTAAFRYVFD